MLLCDTVELAEAEVAGARLYYDDLVAPGLSKELVLSSTTFRSV